jgi:hypothetical protein
VKISDIRVESNVIDRFIGMYFGNIEYEPIAPGDHMLVTNNLWAHGDNNNVTNAQSNMFGPNNITNYLNFSYTHNSVFTGLAYTLYPCSVAGANGDCYTTKFGAGLAQAEVPLEIPGKPNVIFKDNIIGAGNYGYQFGSGGNLPYTDAWTSSPRITTSSSPTPQANASLAQPVRGRRTSSHLRHVYRSHGRPTSLAGCERIISRLPCLSSGRTLA